MFDKDESESKKQQARLNQQLSSLFDDVDEPEEDFEDEFDDFSETSKKKSKLSLKKPILKKPTRNSRKKSRDDYDDFDEDDDDDDVFGSSFNSRKPSRQAPKRKSRRNYEDYFDDYDEDDSEEDSDLNDIFGTPSKQSHKKEKPSRSRPKKKSSQKSSEKKSSKHTKGKSKKSSKGNISSIFKKKNKEEYFDDDEDFRDSSRVSDLYEDDSEDEYGDIGYPEDYEIFDPSENAKERQKSRKARKKKSQPRPGKPVYYDRDGNIIDDGNDEEDKPRWTKQRITKWVIIALVISMISLLGWGWYNTDFDKDGNAYVVPLELLPNRAYIRKADKVLNEILSMDKSFDEDTYYLPTDYSSMYSKLTKEKNELNDVTNELSRYVNVPEDYEGYQTDLINFSLSIQDCIENLIKNREATDYEDYREEVYSEYLQDLNSIKKQRKEIETELFSNVTTDE